MNKEEVNKSIEMLNIIAKNFVYLANEKMYGKYDRPKKIHLGINDAILTIEDVHDIDEIGQILRNRAWVVSQELNNL